MKTQHPPKHYLNSVESARKQHAFTVISEEMIFLSVPKFSSWAYYGKHRVDENSGGNNLG
jgi:hypothetical protein